ncbi:MAG: branched-chain amino acid transporter permease [Oscillospiraceae bacterium]|nr:branched-chain amino acid transporter permease [Oscillospiraceae bacterium]
MILTFPQGLMTVGLIVLATALTRFLPFWVFSEGKKTPDYVVYLGRVLPYAVIGLLVVYCLRSVDLSAPPFGAAELAGVVVTAALHWWKNNTLLSIAGGTACYMLLAQLLLR